MTILSDRKPSIFACILILGMVAACSQQENAHEKQLTTQTNLERSDERNGMDSAAAEQTVMKIERLARLIQEKYAAASSDAKQLQKALLDFIDTPSPVSLDAALTHWESAHTSFRLAALSEELGIKHPVLDQFLPEPAIHHPIMSRIDQFPMIGGYLDEVPGYPRSGLIYSELELSLEQLNQEHQLGDSAYVALGFHALEFLLRGDSGDLTSRHQAFLEQSGENAAAAERRVRYVKILSQQLVDDIALLNQAWSKPEGYYLQYMQIRSPEWFHKLDEQLKLASASDITPEATHAPENFSTLRKEFLEDMLRVIQDKAEAASDTEAPSEKSTSNTASPE